jgi:hypothetical protein
MPPISPRVRPHFLEASLPRMREGLGHISALAAPPVEAGIPVAHATVLIADARRILHIAGGAFAAHGLDTESWIGQTIEQILPPAAVPILLPRYEAALWRVAASGSTTPCAGCERILGSIMWVVALRGDLISSIEVFQAAGGPSLSASQIDRLVDSAPSFASRLGSLVARPRLVS